MSHVNVCVCRFQQLMWGQRSAPFQGGRRVAAPRPGGGSPPPIRPSSSSRCGALDSNSGTLRCDHHPLTGVPHVLCLGPPHSGGGAVRLARLPGAPDGLYRRAWPGALPGAVPRGRRPGGGGNAPATQRSNRHSDGLPAPVYRAAVQKGAGGGGGGAGRRPGGGSAGRVRRGSAGAARAGRPTQPRRAVEAAAVRAAGRRCRSGGGAG